MTEQTVTASASPAKKAASPKKPAVKSKPAAKPSHPPASAMIVTAIKDLKERNGSSLQAIKKYIAAKFVVDAEKQAPFIKKALKAAVTKGTLIQTKGTGAAGSFKLAASAKKATDAKPKVAKPKTPKVRTSEKTAKSLSNSWVWQSESDGRQTWTAKSKAAKPKASAAKKTEKKAAAPKVKKPTVAKKAAATKKPAISKKSTKTPGKPKNPKPKKAPVKKAAKN